MKPSVFHQVTATPIAKNSLKDSPRHWNNGLFRYRGQLWMCYRFHLMTSSGRCRTAICPIDEKTLQPCGPSQTLPMPEPSGQEHQEDARLFTFRGEPFVSYTEMTGYQPGVDFRCVMKYASLKLNRGKWSVEEIWQPICGRNDGASKEKNWVFFEHADHLYCVYAADPEHVVLEMDRSRVVNRYVTPKAYWEWGVMRGGTPPVRLENGDLLTVFHSSLQTERAPHYVRYYAGAYTFEGAPPFAIKKISAVPFLAGSEEDGHQVDPRYVKGWKPYVVFPCGLVDRNDDFLISFGINDWQSAIATVKKGSLRLVASDGTEAGARFFKRVNGSLAVNMVNLNGNPRMMNWNVPQNGAGCSVGVGYMKVVSQREAEDIRDLPGVTEIDQAEYNEAIRGQTRTSLVSR